MKTHGSKSCQGVIGGPLPRELARISWWTTCYSCCAGSVSALDKRTCVLVVNGCDAKSQAN
eukprot:288405-Amphidinium_carterae.1